MLICDYGTWGASLASHWKSDDVMITREVLIYIPNCFLGLLGSIYDVITKLCIICIIAKEKTLMKENASH